MKFICFVVIMSVFFGVSSCSSEKMQEPRFANVNLGVSGVELPSFDINWADVIIGTRTERVYVPRIKVSVDEEDEEMDVPYLDVDIPGGGPKEELTISVEADIKDEIFDLDITMVYAKGHRLNVISELRPTGKRVEGVKMRVFDLIVINAPELDVKYYVVGERPPGHLNKKYSYISSIDDISQKLIGGTLIYRK